MPMTPHNTPPTLETCKPSRALLVPGESIGYVLDDMEGLVRSLGLESEVKVGIKSPQVRARAWIYYHACVATRTPLLIFLKPNYIYQSRSYASSFLPALLCQLFQDLHLAGRDIVDEFSLLPQ